MRKKVKVFEAGNYGFKGEFPVEKVRDIFSKVEGSVMAQYQHSSKLKEAGKSPLELGEFQNFEISDDGVVTAELEFNEKGTMYYEDGAINGVSIELSEAGIDKIAILPVGVKPHVEGAEFSDEGMLTIEGELEVQEFLRGVPMYAIIEELAGLDPVENITEFNMLQDLVMDKTDTGYLAERLKNKGYKVSPDRVELTYDDKKNPEFSKEDFEAEVRAKMEREFKAKEEAVKEFSEMEANGYVTPAMKQAGMNVEFLTNLRLKQMEATEGAIEFGAGDTEYDTMSKILKAIPSFKTESELKAKEFSDDGREARLAKVRESVKLIQNN